ncbi:hypothetical protein [Afipia sp. DC4300-2b1]
MFEASGLGHFETMTHGEGTVSYIEDVETSDLVAGKKEGER